MGKQIEDEDTAIEIAREYAEEECVGEFGEILDVTREDSTWIVEIRTHTFSDEYRHRIQLNRVGNVFSHERMNPIS